MAENEKKRKHAAGKSSPSATDRRVLKRADAELPQEAPDVGGVNEDTRIEPVDLSLHGDGITHWQDEPLSERKARRDSRDEIPKKDET